MLDMPFQEGVVNPGDLVVAQRSAGANKSVDIAAGSGWVKGDTSARQGMYHVVNDATVNLTIPDNTSGNPRVDQIVCQINDTVDGGGIADNAVFSVVQGTATAGATLDNRTGAATLPNTALRIADVLVATGFTSITNSVIRDRRPWAYGAVSQRLRTSGSGASATTTYTNLFSSDVQQRIEISSGLAWAFIRTGFTTAATAYTVFFQLNIDGANAGEEFMVSNPAASALNYDPFWGQILSLSPGSHLFNIAFRANAAQTSTFTGTAAHPTSLTIVEIPSRTSSGNNGTA